MHYRLIVVVDGIRQKKEKESKTRTTSLKIRKDVFGRMLDEGFIDNKKFSYGIADWFVIGGRWSGAFTEIELNKLLWSACLEKLQEDINSTGLNSFYRNLKKTQVNNGTKIFNSFFPKFKGQLPFYRDSYSQTGFSDDAKIIDKKLWNGLIKKLIKECTGNDSEDPLINLDGDAKDLTFMNTVDKKWAVVIDYHT